MKGKTHGLSGSGPPSVLHSSGLAENILLLGIKRIYMSKEVKECSSS